MVSDKLNVNGGPAFPTVTRKGTNVMGMTLRDWLAGQAIAGGVLGVVRPDGDETIEKAMALAAYRVADACLEVRSA